MATRTQRTPGKARSKRAESPASRRISERIRALGDWRGDRLAEVRALIRRADPEVVEEWKWDVPVWSHGGILCTGEAYKTVVKLTFPKGASLKDPRRLFNSSLEGKVRRAIDLREKDPLDAAALADLIRAAVAKNAGGAPGGAARARTTRPNPSKPVLLAGGNPQIAKGDGDGPVEAYLAAVPGWKREVARRLDALVTRTVPAARRAVRWNSPFYGVEGKGWFLALHVFTNYVKATFFKGTALDPVPPGGTGKDARWIDVHEHDLDEARMAAWMRQAAAIPGWGRR